MKNNIIYNNPTQRAAYTYPWAYWDDCFTEEDLNNVIKYCESFDLKMGTTGDLTEENKEKIEKIRKSQVNFHERTPDNAWIFNKINFILQNINEMYYGFDLNGYSFFQYTTYNVGDNYTWHMDTFMGDEVSADLGGIRKLSLTLLLNDDFEGGEFLINNGRENNPIKVISKKGRAILFPSFMIHKVEPILKGTRKSLVVWCLGPKFQ